MEKEKNINGTETYGHSMKYSFTASDYIIKGEYDKALECHQKALAITEKEFGKDHPNTHIPLSDIGDVYTYMGNLEKALEYYQKALAQKLKEPHNGKYPDVTAHIYGDIGNTYRELGEYEKALENYQKVLSIKEKNFEPNHPLIASSYNNIAWTYCLLERYGEALPWAEKCIANYPLVPHFIDTLATAYQGLGRIEEAIEQFELCLKLKKEQGFPYHTEESIHESELKIFQLKKLNQKNG